MAPNPYQSKAKVHVFVFTRRAVNRVYPDEHISLTDGRWRLPSGQQAYQQPPGKGVAGHVEGGGGWGAVFCASSHT